MAKVGVITKEEPTRTMFGLQHYVRCAGERWPIPAMSTTKLKPGSKVTIEYRSTSGSGLWYVVVPSLSREPEAVAGRLLTSYRGKEVI